MYHNCKPINITPQGNFFMTSIPFALAESRDKPKFTMAVVYKILCISYLSFFFCSTDLVWNVSPTSEPQK